MLGQCYGLVCHYILSEVQFMKSYLLIQVKFYICKNLMCKFYENILVHRKHSNEGYIGLGYLTYWFEYKWGYIPVPDMLIISVYMITKHTQNWP